MDNDLLDGEPPASRAPRDAIRAGTSLKRCAPRRPPGRPRTRASRLRLPGAAARGRSRGGAGVRRARRRRERARRVSRRARSSRRPRPRPGWPRSPPARARASAAASREHRLLERPRPTPNNRGWRAPARAACSWSSTRRGAPFCQKPDPGCARAGLREIERADEDRAHGTWPRSSRDERTPTAPLVPDADAVRERRADRPENRARSCSRCRALREGVANDGIAAPPPAKAEAGAEATKARRGRRDGRHHQLGRRARDRPIRGSIRQTTPTHPPSPKDAVIDRCDEGNTSKRNTLKNTMFPRGMSPAERRTSFVTHPRHLSPMPPLQRLLFSSRSAAARASPRAGPPASRLASGRLRPVPVERLGRRRNEEAQTERDDGSGMRVY